MATSASVFPPVSAASIVTAVTSNNSEVFSSNSAPAASSVKVARGIASTTSIVNVLVAVAPALSVMT